MKYITDITEQAYMQTVFNNLIISVMLIFPFNDRLIIFNIIRSSAEKFNREKELKSDK